MWSMSSIPALSICLIFRGRGANIENLSIYNKEPSPPGGDIGPKNKLDCFGVVRKKFGSDKMV